MNRYLALVFAAVAVLAGCGSDSTSSSNPNESTSSGDVLPANELAIDTASYTVKAGEEVRYFCYTMHLPADKDIEVTEIEPIYGKATHHLGVYSPLAPEQDGEFSCDQLVKPTWVPLYGGGVESTKLTMPQGAGMHLKAGQQILIQLHLLNSSDSPVTDKARVILHTSEDTNAIGAGVYGFSNTGVKVPAQSSDVMQGMACNASRDMDVFAVFGHMHQYGRKIEMSRGVNAGDDVLYTAPWDFDNQPTVPTSFHVSKGDNLHLRCWYDNDSAGEIDYGESSTQEMCAFVFYYTPYTELDGCESN